MPRFNWKRDIDSVIDLLGEAIKSGELDSNINSTHLVNNGFSGLYNALTRDDSPRWVSERYEENPWQEFISEIASRVDVDVNVRDSKLSYVSHTYQEIGDIKLVSNMFLSGEMTFEEAIEFLRDDGIEMSDGQIRSYFSRDAGLGRPDDKKTSLDELVERIRRVKKDLHEDLSDINFVKGDLFQALVSTKFAMDNSNYEEEKGLAVDYVDLQGKAHKEVYLDLIGPKYVVEVKWKNSLENILESVLPQYQACKDNLNDKKKIFGCV